MLRRYWVPLMLSELPEAHQLHAALTGWFDDSPENPTGIGHNDGDKPYTISAITAIDGVPGVLISTFDGRADEVMEWISHDRPALWLGREDVLVGAPEMIAQQSWSQIAAARPPRSGAWDVEFQTPTLFRSGDQIDDQINLLPLPGLVLKGVVSELGRHAPEAVPDRSLRVFRNLNIVAIDVTTAQYPFRTHVYPGFVGRIRYASADRRTAAAVAPLFAALPFVGVGAYRARGLGVVEVEPVVSTNGFAYPTKGVGARLRASVSR